MLSLVLVVFKERSWVHISNLCVTKVVDQLCQFVLDILSKLRRVALLMNVKLACAGLEVVCNRSFLAHCNNLVYSPLRISAREVFLTEDEAHKTHQSFLWTQDQILVPDDVKRIALLFEALVAHNPEKLLHVLCLCLYEPGPPLRVLDMNVKVRLVAVAHRICESCVRREDIERVAHHHKCLVRGERCLHLDYERVVGLAYPDRVVDARLSLHSHHLERGARKERYY